jgi:PhnB protein
MHLNIYVTFDGRCEAAFNFYAPILGGRIVTMVPYAETPEAARVPKEWQGKIMHARLELGERALMASDVPPERFEPPKGFHVQIAVKDPAEAEQIFNALAAGGTVTAPIQETFWASKFGTLVDQFGVPWMINCDKPV